MNTQNADYSPNELETELYRALTSSEQSAARTLLNDEYTEFIKIDDRIFLLRFRVPTLDNEFTFRRSLDEPGDWVGHSFIRFTKHFRSIRTEHLNAFLTKVFQTDNIKHLADFDELKQTVEARARTSPDDDQPPTRRTRK